LGAGTHAIGLLHGQGVPIETMFVATEEIKNTQKKHLTTGNTGQTAIMPCEPRVPHGFKLCALGVLRGYE
jgi:hypothetical protein